MKSVDQTTTQRNDGTSEKALKLPPIFIYGVVDYPEMAKKLKNVAEEYQYTTKCLPDDTIKVISITPEIYRIFIKFMSDN